MVKLVILSEKTIPEISEYSGIPEDLLRQMYAEAIIDRVVQIFTIETTDRFE